MKKLIDIINEDFKLKKKGKIAKPNEYNYHPKDKKELRSLLKQLLQERGKDADLNDIDTSAIQDFCYVSPNGHWGLFYNLDIGNIDISKWDMSNATNISYMFYDCKNFNSDLSDWDVSKVKNMDFIFYICKNFNSDLSRWDVSRVEDMTFIFKGCDSLKNKPSWYKG